jgi:hypothetical protein
MDNETETICFVFVHGFDPRRIPRKICEHINRVIPLPRSWGSWLGVPGQWKSLLQERLRTEFPSANFGNYLLDLAKNQAYYRRHRS